MDDRGMARHLRNRNIANSQHYLFKNNTKYGSTELLFIKDLASTLIIPFDMSTAQNKQD